MDDFERALAYANTAPELFRRGRVIHQRLTDQLQAQGVVPYTSAGQPFDPALHEAVDVINTDQCCREWCSTNSAMGIAGAMRCCDRRVYVWRNE